MLHPSPPAAMSRLEGLPLPILDIVISFLASPRDLCSLACCCSSLLQALKHAPVAVHVSPATCNSPAEAAVAAAPAGGGRGRGGGGWSQRGGLDRGGGSGEEMQQEVDGEGRVIEEASEKHLLHGVQGRGESGIVGSSGSDGLPKWSVVTDRECERVISSLRRFTPAAAGMSLVSCEASDSLICSMLQAMPGLRRLYLDGCQKITDSIVSHLCPHLLSSLSSLSLCRCFRLSSASAATLILQANVEHPVSCSPPSLSPTSPPGSSSRLLHFTHMDCQPLHLHLLHPSAAIRAPSIHMPVSSSAAYLRVLLLQSCLNITAQGIKALAAACPHLEVLGFGGSFQGFASGTETFPLPPSATDAVSATLSTEHSSSQSYHPVAAALMWLLHHLPSLRLLEATFFGREVLAAVRSPPTRPSILVFDLTLASDVAAAASFSRSLIGRCSSPLPRKEWQVQPSEVGVRELAGGAAALGWGSWRGLRRLAGLKGREGSRGRNGEEERGGVVGEGTVEGASERVQETEGGELDTFSLEAASDEIPEQYEGSQVMAGEVEEGNSVGEEQQLVQRVCDGIHRALGSGLHDDEETSRSSSSREASACSSAGDSASLARGWEGQAAVADVLVALRCAAMCCNARKETPLHVAAVRARQQLVAPRPPSSSAPAVADRISGDVAGMRGNGGYLESSSGVGITEGLLAIGRAAAAAVQRGAAGGMGREQEMEGERKWVDSRDAWGATALFLAAESGDTPLVELLLLLHASPLSLSNVGESPLYIAALRGHHAALQLMLLHCQQRGIHWQDAGLYGDGWTPLMAAVVAQRTDIVRMLLAFNLMPAFINAKNRHGQTALHLAAGKGCLGLVQLLVVEGGARVGEENNYGMRAVEVARRRGQQEVAAWLREVGGGMEQSGRGGEGHHSKRRGRRRERSIVMANASL